MSAPAATARLDRLLANLGYGSRRDVQQWVKAGAILLDGVPVRVADQRLPLTADLADRLVIAGARVDPLPGFVLMLHKPLGVTCSHKDTGALVYELLPDRWRSRKPAISTVGRLDKETSGLLLLTDDGDALHRLISPRNELPKRYVAQLARPLSGSEAEIFASGTMMLDSETKPLLPAVFEALGPTSARLTLTEGRYHQVRRMFAAVGNHVTALHRDRIGTLDLPDDLAAGQYRTLTAPQRAQVGLP